MAWQHISPEVIVKCFKKWCASNAVDETDVFWHVCAEDGNAKCEDNEGTECEDGDSDSDW